ncbi:unnamed protein product [Phaeothamnion confervicola]
MVVRLRLQRFGRVNRPFYRVVAADARAPRDGKFIEIVGTYDPIANNDGIKEVRLKTERIRYWMSVGAQPSDRVGWLLGQFNVLPMPPRRATTLKHIPKKERRDAAAAGKTGFHTMGLAARFAAGLDGLPGAVADCAASATTSAEMPRGGIPTLGLSALWGVGLWVPRQT